MPDNINLLGLIAILFPRAKVIICQRDPRDVALSCWQIAFRTGSWNNNVDHLAQRLADFQRIKAHWERTPPLACLGVDYENLVGNLEPEARRMIDFIGLDWDPACVQFHSQSRVVRTPSLAQVRRPVHGRSVGHGDITKRLCDRFLERSNGTECSSRPPSEKKLRTDPRRINRTAVEGRETWPFPARHRSPAFDT